MIRDETVQRRQLRHTAADGQGRVGKPDTGKRTHRVLKAVILSGLFSGTLSLPSVQAAPVTTPAILTLHGDALHAKADHFPYANPDAPKYGTHSVQAQGTFDSFNALINKGTPVAGTQYLFDTLTVASLDEPFARYPLLADTITRDPADGSWIMYHLNPKARFSNGLPVRAQDVAFTFNTLLSKGHPGLRSYFADIARVEALDSQRVKFTFKTKDNVELPLTVGEVSILSEADWKNRPFDAVSLTVPVGSGPYRVEKVDVGRSVTYRRNPDYWGKDLPVNRGQFNFERIRYVYYRSSEIAFEGFKAGQYTLREENKARNWSKNYDFPAVKQGMVVKQLIPHQNPVTMQALVMNLRKPQFQDLRIRQALTLAFDFEWMNKAIFNGGYVRLQSYFFNSELGATGTPSTEELAVLKPLLAQLSADEQQAVLSEWKAPISDGSGFNRANLLKARQLLLNAGCRYQGAQLLRPDGQPFRMELLLNDDGLQRVVLPYVRNLKKLGIDASVRQVDIPQYIERARNFDYDMIIDQFPQSLSPGNEQLGYWGSAAANEPGSQNSAGIHHPVIDALLKQLIVARSRPEQLTLTHALDRVLRAGYYTVPMYGVAGYRVAYWNQYQQPKVRPKYNLGVDYWWIDPAKADRLQQYLGQSTGKTTQ